MDELEGVLEWKVWQLSCRVLGRPECSALDRSAETNVRVSAETETFPAEDVKVFWKTLV